MINGCILKDMRIIHVYLKVNCAITNIPSKTNDYAHLLNLNWNTLNCMNASKSKAGSGMPTKVKLGLG
jgi:hypothetical protein